MDYISDQSHGQERLSYYRDDRDVNGYSVDDNAALKHQSQYGQPSNGYIHGQQSIRHQWSKSGTQQQFTCPQAFRPTQLNISIDTSDDVFADTPDLFRSYPHKNVACVRPFPQMARSPQMISPNKFPVDEDMFMTYSTQQLVHHLSMDGAKEDVVDKTLINERNEQLLMEKARIDQEIELERQRYQESLMRRQEAARVSHQLEEEQRLVAEEEELYHDDTDNLYDLEIIEEVITRRKKPQKSESRAILFPVSEPVAMPQNSNDMCSVGVGEGDVNNYYLFDTGSTSVNPADFPPAYWERLSRYFTEEFHRKRPVFRDVASQLRPPAQRSISLSASLPGPPAQRNFGVCVRPSMNSCGFNTTITPSSPDTRSSACMTEDLDEYFARLLRSICRDHPNADSEFIRNLYRYSQTDVSEFIRCLIRRLEDLRRLEESQVVISSPKPQMISTGIDSRPIMKNKRTLSEPPHRSNLGINTELVLQRTQGTHYSPVPETTNYCVSTSSFSHPSLETTVAKQDSESIGQKSPIPSPLPPNPPHPPSAAAAAPHLSHTSAPTSKGTLVGEHKVTTYRVKRVVHRMDSDGHSSIETHETSGEGPAPPPTITPPPLNTTPSGVCFQ